ncbi:MAG: hypothetical protein U1F41_07965 [Burkholderiales bacterium]
MAEHEAVARRDAVAVGAAMAKERAGARPSASPGGEVGDVADPARDPAHYFFTKESIPPGSRDFLRRGTQLEPSRTRSA